MKPSQPSQQQVLVLHESFGADARADEVDALVQVREVSAALQGLGFAVAVAEIGRNLEAPLRRLQSAPPALVFNLVESLGGWGELIGVAPALLRKAGLPFTGSDSEAIILSSQKLLAKRWLTSNGIPAPPVFQEHAGVLVHPDRWIVKSVWEHASFGLDDASVVCGQPAVARRIEKCSRELGGQWFAERYIDGREFNISLLELDGKAQVLPIAEMSFVDYPADKPRIVGYAAKWDEMASEYQATQRSYPELPDTLRNSLETTAQRCWELFGLRGYGRVDIRMDERHVPWVLEVNANPCLASDAGFVAAGRQAGLAFGQIIGHIVDAAIRPGVPERQQPSSANRP